MLSLACRSALIRLLPFSYDELYSYRNENPALESAFFAGLYPPIHDRSLDPQKWYANYVETYVERDVRSLLNIQDLSVFQLFLKMCAARYGQLINLSGWDWIAASPITRPKSGFPFWKQATSCSE
jgi:uncharacterized protein